MSKIIYKGTYPCGCRFEQLDDGSYVHYVHPECRFDEGKIGKKDNNYKYVGWNYGGENGQ